VVYIEARAFTQQLQKLAGTRAPEVLESIQADLAKNPLRGDLVRGLGGIRKARTANLLRGKGKRGGYRYLFLYLERKDHIHLLYLFDKDEQQDLSQHERKLLHSIVNSIRNTAGGS
jgi:hypothetical protein